VDEVAALVDGTADARRIHDRTDGNPFFVRELVHHLADRRDATLDVPESVSDVVVARVARLSKSSSQALSAASVLGTAFTLPVLELLVRNDELAEILDEAVAAGLIDDATSGSYRFAHALTRDAVYSELRPSRRAELHARAAAALEAVHGLEPGPELAAIALHLFESDRAEDAERAIELAESAADWSLELKGYEQAVALLTRALSRAGEGDRRRAIGRKRAVAFQRLTHAYLDV
jgi:predicted ATPase